MASNKELARPVGRWANKASIRQSVSRTVKESIKKDKRYGAATTSNNNSGKGLKAYGRQGLGKGPRDGSGPGTYMSGRTKVSSEQQDGKGLRVYIPRKRKPKVALPKGRSNG